MIRFQIENLVFWSQDFAQYKNDSYVCVRVQNFVVIVVDKNRKHRTNGTAKEIERDERKVKFVYEYMLDRWIDAWECACVCSTRNSSKFYGQNMLACSK